MSMYRSIITANTDEPERIDELVEFINTGIENSKHAKNPR